MASLTIRNIPDSVLTSIKALSELERRSLNSEILFLLEAALRGLSAENTPRAPSPETQAAVWETLAGQWKDGRETADIIRDIREHRTGGRDFRL